MKPEIGQLIIDTSLNPGYEIRPHGIQTLQLSCYFQTLEMVIQPSFFLILQICHGNSHSFSFEVYLEVLVHGKAYCYGLAYIVISKGEDSHRGNFIVRI